MALALRGEGVQQRAVAVVGPDPVGYGLCKLVLRRGRLVGGEGEHAGVHQRGLVHGALRGALDVKLGLKRRAGLDGERAPQGGAQHLVLGADLEESEPHGARPLGRSAFRRGQRYERALGDRRVLGDAEAYLVGALVHVVAAHELDLARADHQIGPAVLARLEGEGHALVGGVGVLVGGDGECLRRAGLLRGLAALEEPR